MVRDYRQATWDEELEGDCRELIRLALREDLRDRGDLTSAAVVDAEARGTVQMVTRQAGVVCGLRIPPLVIAALGCEVTWTATASDGDAIQAGDQLGQLTGTVRGLLTAERLILNLASRLSGVATLTRAYVDAVAGTGARVYDTRKTTPGYRRLEKYAVRCGGGMNHRLGLCDGWLIKDNHLGHMATASADAPAGPRQAVEQAIRHRAALADSEETLVEVEVDTLEQFDEALAAEPDVVLLDNMACDILRTAVARRDAARSATTLEASGGVNLQTIRAIAETGVERISVGALTHQAVSLDIGLDWSTS
ncbi:MAG TPA: carboxylating nicotinate-nucleotide diphosphorylase [Planctomycetaceae bacterium]|nr:nicotinate-nucleotide diphosphorylase (carboxylating) [Blastopirellula sp.]HAY82319.1 carboxylating nicotinate-nucleotide diphosphorylase [Planctomycetaceae bacterium]